MWWVAKWLGCDKGTNEYLFKYCGEEAFQLARVKLDREGEGEQWIARVMCFSIFIWEEELELA